MSLLNIGGDQNDASYRYKMPRLTTKIEGRGNGIKTVVPNMVDIAKALHTPPSYPTKFFGIELGAQSKFNKKDERAIVNGAHQAKDMQEVLGKFIDIFILCPTCKLPELNMEVKKSSIKIDCAACGHNGALPTAHRLTTYILKNPPGKKKGEKGGKKSKRDRKKGKDKSKKGETAAVEKKDDVMARGEEEWFTDASKAAQKQRMAEEFAEMDSSVSVSKEVDMILEQAKADNTLGTPVVVLKVFLAGKERSVSEIVSELRRVQLSRGLDDPQRLKVLLEALIDCSNVRTVHEQFGKHAALLQNFAKDRAQGTTLINCLEELVGVTHPKLMIRVPHIMQKLYEEDVLDEETIVAWHDSPPESSWLVNKEVATEVREKAQPLVDWLKAAESEEDSSDEEE